VYAIEFLKRLGLLNETNETRRDCWIKSTRIMATLNKLTNPNSLVVLFSRDPPKCA